MKLIQSYLHPTWATPATGYVAWLDRGILEAETQGKWGMRQEPAFPLTLQRGSEGEGPQNCWKLLGI